MSNITKEYLIENSWKDISDEGVPAFEKNGNEMMYSDEMDIWYYERAGFYQIGDCVETIEDLKRLLPEV